MADQITLLLDVTPVSATVVDVALAASVNDPDLSGIVETGIVVQSVGGADDPVALHLTVLGAMFARSEFTTSPGAVNAVVTVRFGAVSPLGSVVAIDGTPLPFVTSTPELAVPKFPRVPALL